MFTGLIESVGSIAGITTHGDDLELEISFAAIAPDSLRLGESIAVSGVCLTVRQSTTSGFIADVSVESLRRTTLGAVRVGDPVNLERSLQIGDRLGGHFVFGHVDGFGRVLDLKPEGQGFRLAIEAPQNLKHLIAIKGSIAVDGVSLTVAHLQGPVFEIALIPHTAQKTTLGGLGRGRSVNLEADMLARYVERVLQRD